MTLKEFIQTYERVGLEITEEQRQQVRNYLQADGFPMNRISRSYRSTDSYLYFYPKRYTFSERQPVNNEPETLHVNTLARLQEIYQAVKSQGVLIQSSQSSHFFFVVPDGLWSLALGYIPNSELVKLYNAKKDINDPDVEV